MKGGKIMQSLEEYFIKRKKKDRMDEFDLNLHSENMSKAIQYVISIKQRIGTVI